MQGWAEFDGEATFFFFLWSSAGSQGCRLSFVLFQHQTVSPHGGHEKKSRGITRECLPLHVPPFCLSSSISSSSSPFLLTSLVLYFLLGSIPREGKWNCFLGSMSKSARSQLPECSYLLCVLLEGFTALNSCLCGFDRLILKLKQRQSDQWMKSNVILASYWWCTVKK